jgi:hypothetical protein
MRRFSLPRPDSPAARGAATALLLALVAASACKRGDRTPPPAAGDSATAAAAAAAAAADTLTLPAGPWHRVAQDAQTLVAIDTSAIVARPDGDATVRLHYAFAQPQSVPEKPELVFRTIRSEEVTECARATSHPNRAILYDSAGKEVGHATRPPGPRAPGMIGNAGGALCAYLRSVKKVRAGGSGKR